MMSTNQEIAIALLFALCIAGLLALMGGFLIIAMAWSGYDQTDRDRADAAQRRPSGAELMRRAIARRCPRCGRGALFRRYMIMNQSCSECGAIFWQNAGEWMGPVVIDYSVAAGGALVAWSITALLNAPEFFQIIVPVLVGVAGGAAVVPWSRSLWTLFLFVNDEMGVASKPARTARLKPLTKKVLEFGRHSADKPAAGRIKRGKEDNRS